MLVIPWMMAWDMNLRTRIRDTLIFTAIFWTVDIGLSFFTGFYDDGTIERRPAVIARRYIRGWFVVDAVLVFFDWTSIVSAALMDSGANNETVSLSLKAARLLRILDLIRTIRLSHLFEEVLDRVLKGAFRTALGIVKLLGMVLWLSHLTSCLWFLIGSTYAGGTGAVWFDSVQYLPAGTDFLSTNRLYQYSTSFHFALSQIAANGVEMLSPLNSLERGFNIVCLIFGLFFTSHVVSTSSSAMMNLEMANQHKNQRLRQLKQLLSQNGVNSTLAVRVVRQVNERMNSPKLLMEEDVPALQLLSAALLKELRYAMASPVLIRHPLMRLFLNCDDHVVPEICHKGMQLIMVPVGDALFNAQNIAEKMYFLESGCITYTLRESMAFKVVGGKHLSEATLWCSWTHQGDAIAVDDCKVFSLDAEATCAVLGHHNHEGHLAAAYGRKFHHHLQNAYPPAAPYPDDLQVAFTDYSDIVMDMTSREQRFVADIAMQSYLDSQANYRWGGQRLAGELLESLEEEIHVGKSIIIQDEDGQTQRLVSLVVLELEHADGRILAQIGKIQDGELTIELQRPGGKQCRHELPSQAMERIFWKDQLQKVKDRIEVVDLDRDTVWKESARYGLRTKYLRTIHYARLDSDCRLESEYVPVISPLAAERGSIFSNRGSRESENAIPKGSWPRTLPAQLYMYGLDAPALCLGQSLCMFFERENWDYWKAGNGKDLLNMYAEGLRESLHVLK